MNKEEAIKEIERTIEQVSVYLPADDEWIISLTLVIAALHAQTDTAPNDPLTLEELRKMIGEPLWVVPLGKEPDWKPCWVICMEDYILVHSTTSESRGFILRRNENYGKTWLAYRHKPSE